MSSIFSVYKIVLVGDENVGKTSLVRRYCDHNFKMSRIETIGIDFHSSNIQLDDNLPVTVVFWDVAGKGRFASFRDQFYGGALCVGLVYDVTVPISFRNLKEWQREVDRYVTGVPMAVIANKSDLDAVVPEDEAQEWAASNGYPFIKSSAKTGLNVDTLFHGLAQLAHHYRNDLESLEDMNMHFGFE